MRLVMIEDNQFEVERFTRYCAGAADVELIAATGSMREGLALVEEHCPDAVILDIQLEEGNGLDFVYELKDLDLPNSPYIIVTTNISNEATQKSLMDQGAGFVQLKTQPGYHERGPEMVIGFLRRMRPYLAAGQTGAPREECGDQADEHGRARITQMLGMIGCRPNTLSSHYLVEAILVESKQKNGLVDMENVIYPELIRRFRCTKKALERAMRYRIERIWRKTDVRILEKYYTQYIDPERGKPLLREFISYYANQLKG